MTDLTSTAKVFFEDMASIKLSTKDGYPSVFAILLIVMKKLFSFLVSLLGLCSAVRVNVRQDEPPVHLAVSPNCGALHGTVKDLNAGVDPSMFKTIVSFGVRYAMLPLFTND